jgi:hypothetical protein
MLRSGLADEASRPARSSRPEPKRQGEVGSLRRRGEVWLPSRRRATLPALDNGSALRIELADRLRSTNR